MVLSSYRYGEGGILICKMEGGNPQFENPRFPIFSVKQSKWCTDGDLDAIKKKKRRNSAELESISIESKSDLENEELQALATRSHGLVKYSKKVNKNLLLLF